MAVKGMKSDVVMTILESEGTSRGIRGSFLADESRDVVKLVPRASRSARTPSETVGYLGSEIVFKMKRMRAYREGRPFLRERDHRDPCQVDCTDATRICARTIDMRKLQVDQLMVEEVEIVGGRYVD